MQKAQPHKRRAEVSSCQFATMTKFPVLLLFFPLIQYALAASRTTPPSGAIVVRKGTTSSGEFATLTAALKSLPNDSSSRSIFIFPGTYAEQIDITRSGPLTVISSHLFHAFLFISVFICRFTGIRPIPPRTLAIKLSSLPVSLRAPQARMTLRERFASTRTISRCIMSMSKTHLVKGRRQLLSASMAPGWVFTLAGFSDTRIPCMPMRGHKFSSRVTSRYPLFRTYKCQFNLSTTGRSRFFLLKGRAGIFWRK
jgi:hypothetical protein